MKKGLYMSSISSPFNSVNMPIRELQFDNYLRNQDYKSKTIATTNKSSSNVDGTSIKLENFKDSKESKESEAINSITKPRINNHYEMIISNLNFGFNNETKDFYIKVSRGNITNQYPTEDMMKIKKFMLSNLDN